MARVGAWDDREVVMLAHLLGGRGSAADAEALGDRVWLDLGGIPEAAFSLPKTQIALLLRTLFDGSARVTAIGGDRIELAGQERTILDGVARLLLRFGILAAVRESEAGPVLTIEAHDDQRRLLQEIGLSGEAAAALLERVRTSSPAPASDTRVWRDVEQVIAKPGTQSMPGVTAVLERSDLDLYATNDVFWDSVVAIEPLGEEQVFDATVAGGHNFIANGIAVHNSIEQDADMVILLHRDEAYDRETPRKGEADFIIAKHRNGPTDTIVVAFQGHYARFVDMAQDTGGGGAW